MTYSPPPYEGPVAKKSTNPLVWVFVALGAFCCIAIIGFGAMGWGVWNGTRDMFPCIFTSKILGDSMKEYVKEKGKYPDAATWQTDLAPYYSKASDKFKQQMSDAPGPMKGWGDVADISKPLECNRANPQTYLIYNTELSGKKAADVKDPDTTAMIFEDTMAELNGAKPYKRLEFKDSPRVMGSPRGWYVILVNGEMEMENKSGRRQSVRIDTGH